MASLVRILMTPLDPELIKVLPWYVLTPYKLTVPEPPEEPEERLMPPVPEITPFMFNVFPEFAPNIKKLAELLRTSARIVLEPPRSANPMILLFVVVPLMSIERVLEMSKFSKPTVELELPARRSLEPAPPVITPPRNPRMVFKLDKVKLTPLPSVVVALEMVTELPVTAKT